MLKMPIVQHFLVFCFIFAFPIYSFLNSIKLVTFVTIFFIVIGFSTKFAVQKISSFRFSIFFSIMFYFVIVTIIYSLLNKNCDLSLAKKILSSQILIITVIFFYSFLTIDIQESIWYVFIFQSIIILLGILFKPFYDFTSLFRNVSAEHVESYNRLRGNAISGYQFFGLSSMYGFVIIWFLFLKKKKTFGSWLLFGLVLIAALLSGRYVITSVLIVIVFKLFACIYKVKFGKVIISTVLVFVLSLSSIQLIFSIGDQINDEGLKKVYNHYVLDPVNSLLTQNKFKTTSTSALIKMYSIDISDAYVFGKGQYTNKVTGLYYRDVDIGFYRIVLYYGLPGSIILCLLFVYFIFLNFTGNIPLLVCYTIFFIVLNLKGDVQIYSNNILPVIVGLGFVNNQVKRTT